MNNWFTIAEVEEKVGIPHQTIRRYMDRHSHYISIQKKHKSIMVYKESIKVIVKIRELYSKGLNAIQVDQELSISGLPLEYVLEDEKEMVKTLGKTLDNMEKNMTSILEQNKQLHEKYENQEKFNKVLLERLEKQEEHIRNNLENRDRQLTKALNEMQETRKQIASTEEDRNKEKRGFWSNLFNKK